MQIFNTESSSAQEVVILLHGLFATRRSMRTAKRKLEASGYRVVNWGYPTFWKSIESHGRALIPTVRELQRDHTVKSIHFLTHSMGGILVRYALQISSLAKIHRVVMLAPPNAGSHLTRLSLGPFRRFLPAIEELSEARDSLPNRLVAPDCIEVGVIAAESDVIVRVPSTVLANQRDHCVVPTSHFALPHHEGALEMALNFIADGSFRPFSQVQAAA